MRRFFLHPVKNFPGSPSVYSEDIFYPFPISGTFLSPMHRSHSDRPHSRLTLVAFGIWLISHNHGGDLLDDSSSFRLIQYRAFHRLRYTERKHNAWETRIFNGTGMTAITILLKGICRFIIKFTLTSKNKYAFRPFCTGPNHPIRASFLGGMKDER